MTSPQAISGILGVRGYAVTMASHGMGFTVTRKGSND